MERQYTPSQHPLPPTFAEKNQNNSRTLALPKQHCRHDACCHPGPRHHNWCQEDPGQRQAKTAKRPQPLGKQLFRRYDKVLKNQSRNLSPRSVRFVKLGLSALTGWRKLHCIRQARTNRKKLLLLHDTPFCYFSVSNSLQPKQARSNPPKASLVSLLLFSCQWQGRVRGSGKAAHDLTSRSYAPHTKTVTTQFNSGVDNRSTEGNYHDRLN
jgi:hypothetical protein